MDTAAWMDRALDLAQRGWGRVHPNPMVGAVVVRGGEVVGEGYHAEFGGPHAESVALDAAGDKARGADLFVTLEPCGHQGKQPPCAGMIPERGIRRVFVATPDPNLEAAGGIQRLRQASVKVDVGIRGEEARYLNAMFFHQHTNHSRPFVALKLATSVDFRIADHAGNARWVSGEPAREWVHWLRAGFDAIAVGGRTARVDNPALTVRGAVTPRVIPRRVVFSRTGDLPLKGRLLQTASAIETWVVSDKPLAPARVDALQAAGAQVLEASSIGGALESLREVGIGSLLIEGGGRMAGSVLDADLVDRFHWVQAPLWFGEDGTPAVAGLASFDIDATCRWTVVSRQTLGDDMVVTLDRDRCSPAL